MAFLDTLPDPNYKMNLAGISDASGIASPGFMELNLSSSQSVMKSNTNSQRFETDTSLSHAWKLQITYNELTCEQFHPVYSFLMLKRAAMEPFYVSLPQYRNQDTPQKSSDTAVEYQIDYDRIEVEDISTAPETTKPGQMFRTDQSDKLYMVTRVETPSSNVYALTGSNDERIWFTPGLVTTLPANSILSFDNIRMKAVQSGDILEYELGADNLFKFSVRFEEVF